MKNEHALAEESLGYMTITAYRLMNATLRHKFKKSDIALTPEQWGALFLLGESGSATQDELAAALCLDKSSMSRLLSAMQDKGLISRNIDPANERKKIVQATQNAHVVRERGFELAGEALKNSLRGVSPEETATCLKVLRAVKHNLRGKYG